MTPVRVVVQVGNSDVLTASADPVALAQQLIGRKTQHKRVSCFKFGPRRPFNPVGAVIWTQEVGTANRVELQDSDDFSVSDVDLITNRGSMPIEKR